MDNKLKSKIKLKSNHTLNKSSQKKVDGIYNIDYQCKTKLNVTFLLI